MLNMIKAKGLWTSILMILLGCILTFNPGGIIIMITKIIGTVILIGGIVGILQNLLDKQKTLRDQMSLVGSIIAGLVGIFILLRAQTVSSILLFLLGILILFYGASQIAQAIDIKKHNYDHWTRFLLIGLITIFLGAFVVINPFKSGEILIRIIGVILIYGGVTGILAVYRIGKYL